MVEINCYIITAQKKIWSISVSFFFKSEDGFSIVFLKCNFDMASSFLSRLTFEFWSIIVRMSRLTKMANLLMGSMSVSSRPVTPVRLRHPHKVDSKGSHKWPLLNFFVWLLLSSMMDLPFRTPNSCRANSHHNWSRRS